ncbi:uncharacterized protein LOC133920690 [Phragmites australis]|uniref:uncharacterized protein LOC133920690 n=1 Tax=Phragmites australis TaxID=29695 RepID=UPI002D7936AF|nr:uncharacterized protein LOC133920690 [Phragmites australis]
MGLEFELLSGDQLQPIRTAAAAARAATTTQPDGDVDGCATPTSAANVLLAPLVCPPAPRKPRPPAKRKLQHRRGRRCGSAAPPPAPALWFIAVPHDVLAAVFVARPASARRPPAAKKVRVHVVG